MVIISVLNICLMVVLTNMLFCLVGATINKKQSRLLMVVLSFFGGVVFATLKLFMLPKIGLVLIALVLFGCSSVVLFYPQKVSSFVILQVVTVSYILVGSAISYLIQLIFFNLFEFGFATYLIYNLLQNIVLVLMGGAVFYLFKINYRRKVIFDFVFDCLIELAGRRVRLKMLLDSGNMLYDTKTGLPIIVVNKTIFENKLGYMIVEEECRKIEYTTISGEYKKLSILKPDKIYILKNGKYSVFPAMIGVIEKDFKIYDGLLHASVA